MGSFRLEFCYNRICPYLTSKYSSMLGWVGLCKVMEIFPHLFIHALLDCKRTECGLIVRGVKSKICGPFHLPHISKAWEVYVKPFIVFLTDLSNVKALSGIESPLKIMASPNRLSA